MIRVLSIIHYPVFGGPHNRNGFVAPFLKSQRVETTVLLPNEKGNGAERLLKAGVEVVTIPLSRIRAKINPIYHFRMIVNFLSDIRRIRAVIRRKRINVVQINGLVNPQGAIAAKMERVPVVWQVLDTFAPMFLRCLCMLLVRMMADVVMCTGFRVAREHPGMLSFKERLILFYPPVDLKRFNNNLEKKRAARNALGLPRDAFVIGNVGNINLQKGHLSFVRAAAKVKKAIPNCRFVILGAMHENHQAYIARLLREASDLGLEKDYDLIIRDPGTMVAELEPAFDVFWMTPEPRSEGIPTAIEEAMALGIPVVATKAGSIEEIVIENKTGFITEPYDIDAISKQTTSLYFDENLRRLISDEARLYASKKFGVENCAYTHLRAYKMALSRSGRIAEKGGRAKTAEEVIH